MIKNSVHPSVCTSICQSVHPSFHLPQQAHLAGPQFLWQTLGPLWQVLRPIQPAFRPLKLALIPLQLTPRILQLALRPLLLALRPVWIDRWMDGWTNRWLDGQKFTLFYRTDSYQSCCPATLWDQRGKGTTDLMMPLGNWLQLLFDPQLGLFEPKLNPFLRLYQYHYNF